MDELNALLEQFRNYYNHHRPHRALRGATPAETFHATHKARPADRPLPQPVFVNRQVVSAGSGNLTVGPYIVNVGRRWSGHACDTICDGTHIVIFSGTTLVRELTANPNRRYQNGHRKPGTHGKREPKPAP
ncbi:MULTISPECIES: integrase core domain-containing protein [unclassified Mycobacterium]|uniref:integrase core domain-containing protein n=1 Tax=unclassified Mycobacterium TaxID=2642494 RepID=UPI001E43D66D|nr:MULTISPECIES: integrase core domain-containing protein [unclassified Mycobacterium]